MVEVCFPDRARLPFDNTRLLNKFFDDCKMVCSLSYIERRPVNVEQYLLLFLKILIPLTWLGHIVTLPLIDFLFMMDL